MKIAGALAIVIVGVLGIDHTGIRLSYELTAACLWWVAYDLMERRPHHG
jgi:hypothetical protein